MEIKDTLNLPETDFPMKASLTKAEPKMLEWWAKEKIYEEIRESSRGKENLFSMMVLLMQMVISIWGTLSIRFLKILL